jgi:coenzyme F420-0:L-glutamate ligase / coenzyme F420-1:gamma-L-glutamate ligase
MISSGDGVMSNVSPAQVVLATLRSRRSIRRYLPQAIESAVIETLLEAAIWAPSAHNRQPWRFAVIQDLARKERLASAMAARLRADLEADGVDEAVIAADTGRSYVRITGAPVLIALCLSMVDMDTYSDARRQAHEHTMAVQSTAMAGQNLLLAAHALGLAACWMCAPLFVPELVRDVLELPADWQPQALLTLGYAAETKEKPRHPIEKSVLWR